jgi:hypothetical protein
VRHCWRVLNTILNTTTVTTVHLGRQSKAVGFCAVIWSPREWGSFSQGHSRSCKLQKAICQRRQECHVATPHCPILPAGHDLLTLCPTRACRNREPVLRLRQASSNSCSDCARSVRLWSPAQFLPGAGTHESPFRPGQTKGNHGAGEHRIPGRGHSICSNHTEFARKRRRGMGSLPSSQGLLEEVGGLSWRKL